MEFRSEDDVRHPIKTLDLFTYRTTHSRHSEREARKNTKE